MQGNPASDEHLQPRASGKELSHDRSRAANLFEVVQHDQEVSRLQPLADSFEVAETFRFAQLQGLREGDRHQLRIGNRGQGDEDGAEGEAGLKLLGQAGRQPGLADSARARQRQEPHVLVFEEACHGFQLALAAKEGCV